VCAGCDAGRVRGGLAWYRLHGRRIVDTGAAHGLTPEASVALFAALSPQTSIQRNWSNFKVCVQDRSARRAVYASRAMRAKINGFYRGTFTIADITAGPKVTSFYRNLLGDEEVVTVDRHAAALVYGAPLGKQCLTIGMYRYCEIIIQAAAAILEITPAQCQAIAWIAWRRQQGIRDGGGMTLVA
jgi:hypothetical protein